MWMKCVCVCVEVRAEPVEEKEDSKCELMMRCSEKL